MLRGIATKLAFALALVGTASAQTKIDLPTQVKGVLPAANGGAGTANGLLKANGSGTVSAAVSGTDYAPATSGGSLLYGNGSGGFSNVTIGSNLTFVGGTLSSSSGFSGALGTNNLTGTGTANRIGTATTNDALADWMFSASATTQKPIVVQMKASQTANPMEWQNSDGTVAGSLGVPGVNNNVRVGTVGHPGLTLTSGVDTLYISADNQYHSSIYANNALNFFAVSGVGFNGPVYNAATTDQSGYDGVTVDRRSLWFGRHAGALTGDPVTSMGPIIYGVTPLLADEPTTTVRFVGQPQWSQSTTNTSGGPVLLSGGPGRRFYTFVTPNSTGAKTVTLTANGTATTLTEGTNFNCNTLTTTQCATNLAAAINANTTLNKVITATASSANVYLDWNRTAGVANSLYSLDIATNAGAAITTTSGVDGTVQVASGMQLATRTQPTCAAAYAGTFWYVAGGAGVKDSVTVCAKDATDTYAWRTIY